VRRLYKSGTQSTVPKETAKYKLDVVSVREVRWEKGGTVSAGDCVFSKAKRKSSIIDSKFGEYFGE